MAPDDNDERRVHKRLPTNLTVRIASGDHTHDTEARDVSVGGVGLVSKEKLERGTRVAVEVLLDGSQTGDPAAVKTMATVMWSAETDTGVFTAGLKFDGPSPEALERLGRFLATSGK